jgi:hypothetical protein
VSRSVMHRARVSRNPADRAPRIVEDSDSWNG